MNRLVLLFFLCFLGDGGAAQPVDEETRARISEALRGLFPEVRIDAMRKAPLEGVVEVLLGAEILYISADAKHLVQGDLYTVDSRRNLTEERRSSARAGLLGRTPEAELISYRAKREEHAVYVFTDHTCPYCRRFHEQIRALNDLGITVHYLAFPRRGPDSTDFRNMESIWCARDREKAMADAKLAQKIEPVARCENPVAKQYSLGRDIGVRGTPAIYLENGKQIGGYAEADAIAALIRDEGL